MRCRYWIKMSDERPLLWDRDSFEALWHDVREYMLRGRVGAHIEWMIEV